MITKECPYCGAAMEVTGEYTGTTWFPHIVGGDVCFSQAPSHGQQAILGMRAAQRLYADRIGKYLLPA